MAEENNLKCANPQCGCPVEATGDYCSTECEASAAGHPKGPRCDCGHDGCREKPRVAKVQIGY